MENLFFYNGLSGHDAAHCDHIPFCWSGSRSIQNIQKPVVKRYKKSC